MSRLVKLPVDEAAGLRRLLAMIEAAPGRITVPFPGHVDRSDEPPPDRFEGRRILAWIEEREARRIARRARHS